MAVTIYLCAPLDSVPEQHVCRGRWRGGGVRRMPDRQHEPRGRDRVHVQRRLLHFRLRRHADLHQCVVSMRHALDSTKCTDIRLGLCERPCDCSAGCAAGTFSASGSSCSGTRPGNQPRIHAHSARLARLARLHVPHFPMCAHVVTRIQSAVPTPSAWRPRRRARPARPAAPAPRARRRAHAMLVATGPDPASRFHARVRGAPHLPMLH